MMTKQLLIYYLMKKILYVDIQHIKIMLEKITPQKLKINNFVIIIYKHPHKIMEIEHYGAKSVTPISCETFTFIQRTIMFLSINTYSYKKNDIKNSIICPQIDKVMNTFGIFGNNFCVQLNNNNTLSIIKNNYSYQYNYINEKTFFSNLIKIHNLINVFPKIIYNIHKNKFLLTKQINFTINDINNYISQILLNLYLNDNDIIFNTFFDQHMLCFMFLKNSP